MHVSSNPNELLDFRVRFTLDPPKMDTLVNGDVPILGASRCISTHHK